MTAGADPRPPVLVGDGVETPGNADAMVAAAGMFGWSCAFVDRRGLAERWPAGYGAPPRFLSAAQVPSACSPMVAFDNAAGAESVYGFRPGSLAGLGRVVGNERRGVTPGLLRGAQRVVALPMASRRVNCLNVAAAAAVALYYLSRGGGGRQLVRDDPRRHRPELLLMGAGDHVELGSAIRSAAALGWSRVLIEDRAGVWFGCDRIVRSQGRAAARRGKNSIRLLPAPGDRRYAFEEAWVVSLRGGGQPLARTQLARGPSQLVVLVDEEQVRLDAEDFGRLARTVHRAAIERPAGDRGFGYRFRWPATIALAEIARQVGARAPGARRVPQPPLYDRVLRGAVDEGGGEVVTLQELATY